MFGNIVFQPPIRIAHYLDQYEMTGILILYNPIRGLKQDIAKCFYTKKQYKEHFMHANSGSVE